MPPRRRRQAGEAVPGAEQKEQSAAAPRAVLTKLAHKRKPKMAFLFEEAETEAGGSGGPAAAKAAAPKRSPKLAFLFDDAGAQDGAAPQAQPGPELQPTDAAADAAADAAPAGAARIEAEGREPIEKPREPAVAGSAAANTTAPATPSRRPMAISKNLKLQRRQRRVPHDERDNTAGAAEAEALATNSAAENSAAAQVEAKETRQPHTDDAAVSPSPTVPTEDMQHEVRGTERHEQPADAFSGASEQEVKQGPAAVISKSLKRSRYLQACEAATDSPGNGETHAPPHVEEKVAVAKAIAEEPAPDLAQQPHVGNGKPKSPHFSDEVREVGETKTAALSRPAITKTVRGRLSKKYIAQKRAVREKPDRAASYKGAEEEAAERIAEGGEEAERKRAAEEEAERKRVAEEEAERKRAAEEEAERKRAAEEEAERKRAAEEEAERKRAAEEEAERKRAAEEEAERKRAAEEEAERKRAAEEEAERKRVERRPHKRKQKGRTRRKAREEAARKKA
ncbi:kinetoplast-associated protein, partial [Trypanosoma conorhini]